LDPRPEGGEEQSIPLVCTPAQRTGLNTTTGGASGWRVEYGYAKNCWILLTWTTYGTWLQGSIKGFVKDGEVRGENAALQKSGYDGKVWTRGYDKRFCFDQKGLRERTKYVEGHR